MRPLSDGSSRLPDFLVIGAMKAGTTALHSYLAMHPRVYMSRPKELNFFIDEFNWSRGVQWYADFFSAAGSAQRVGESSPHYSQASRFRGVPSRIASLIPDVQLIYLLRHPIKRIRSAYLHRYSRGREFRSFSEAVAHDEPYVNDSRYAWQLEQYLAHFDRSQILVVESEQLQQQRSDALGDILSFLGLELDERLCGDLPEVHVTAQKKEFHTLVSWALRLGGPLKAYVPNDLKRRIVRAGAAPLDTRRAILTTEIERELRDRLADDVRRLRTHLRADFHGWGIA